MKFLVVLGLSVAVVQGFVPLPALRVQSSAAVRSLSMKAMPMSLESSAPKKSMALSMNAAAAAADDKGMAHRMKVGGLFGLWYAAADTPCTDPCKGCFFA
jgi:hypothetical protein